MRDSQTRGIKWKNAWNAIIIVSLESARRSKRNVKYIILLVLLQTSDHMQLNVIYTFKASVCLAHMFVSSYL